MLNLKERRQELGLTLEEVGNACGVGKSTVRKWETGMIQNMRRDKVALLANVLHVNPMDIVGIEDHDDKEDRESVNAIIQKLHENPRLGVLFDKSSKMSSKDLDAVMNIVDAILRERDND